MSLAQYSKEELADLSLIEMAYEYLKGSKEPIAFTTLVSEISAAAGISEQETRTRIAQFYTDLNIDGRFLTLGENRWGLRDWYPIDTVEEEVHTAKPKKKKAKKVVDEDLDDFDEVEEEEFDDIDAFDDEEDVAEDEDEDEVFDEIDEVDDEFEDEDDLIEEDEEFELDEEEDLDLDEDEDEDELDPDEEEDL